MHSKAGISPILQVFQEIFPQRIKEHNEKKYPLCSFLSGWENTKRRIYCFGTEIFSTSEIPGWGGLVGQLRRVFRQGPTSLDSKNFLPKASLFSGFSLFQCGSGAGKTIFPQTLKSYPFSSRASFFTAFSCSKFKKSWTPSSKKRFFEISKS